jgi:hypothetical protein
MPKAYGPSRSAEQGTSASRVKCGVTVDADSAVDADGPDPAEAVRQRPVSELEACRGDLGCGDVLRQDRDVVPDRATELWDQRRPSRIPRRAMEIRAADAR